MIYPMFCMVLLTVSVGVLAFFARVESVSKGHARARSYKLMDADDFPERVIKTTRNFNNQFEVPVLFYAGCLAHIALDVTNAVGLFAAWGFVLFRVAHSAIHLTRNQLLHRIIAFWLAVLMMLVLWISLMISIN